MQYEVIITVEATIGEMPRQRGWEITQLLLELFPKTMDPELVVRSETAKIVTILGTRL